MNPSFRSIFTACAATAAIAFSGGAPAGAATDSLTVDLHAQNGSGETGTAALMQKPEGVEIVITLANAPADAQPAHVHLGTCSDLGAPQYPLTSVTKGNSVTIVKDATIDQLLSKPMAINVHKSTSDLATYVACGDIAAH
jgi:hypothetical protein